MSIFNFIEENKCETCGNMSWGITEEAKDFIRDSVIWTFLYSAGLEAAKVFTTVPKDIAFAAYTVLLVAIYVNDVYADKSYVGRPHP